VARVELTFLVDANGVLSVTAADMRTGHERTVEVKPTHGLTDEELERMLEESIDHAEDDVHQRMVREARVDAEQILAVTHAQLRKHERLLEVGEGTRIEVAMATLAQATGGDDAVAIRDAYDALSQTTEPFARRIMDEAIRETVEGRTLEEL
jgi:molecular chaperone HscA